MDIARNSITTRVISLADFVLVNCITIEKIPAAGFDGKEESVGR
tara:strand:+ start:65 stop:196 length:132 start_codon:yes stop_codon:yes gene_type:complete